MKFPFTTDQAKARWATLSVRLVEDGDCLVLPTVAGRPQTKIAGYTVKAAHVAYAAAGRVLPEDAECIRHTCDNLRCLNAEHLLPGTIEDNNRDARERSRFVPPPGYKKARDGRCWKGLHDITKPGAVRITFRVNGAGRYQTRTCVECARDRARRSRKEKVLTPA